MISVVRYSGLSSPAVSDDGLFCRAGLVCSPAGRTSPRRIGCGSRLSSLLVGEGPEEAVAHGEFAPGLLGAPARLSSGSGSAHEASAGLDVSEVGVGWAMSKARKPGTLRRTQR